MHITPIGWLLIPMGIILGVVAPRRLYLATIFFAPFSATAVLNVGAGDSASGLQTYVYFTFLLVLRASLISVNHLRIRIPKAVRRSLTYLSTFVTICAISIIMPLWIDGRLQIMSPLLYDMTSTPLQFASSNLTGVIYLLLGASSAAIVAKKTLDPQQFRRTVKTYVLSGFFVSMWGLMQLGCRLLDIPYPSFVFNTSATLSAQGFDSLFDKAGFQRISSVAVEPSVFAACLLTMIPFWLASLFGEGYVVSRKADRWLFAAMLTALLFSTSSTAYVGIIVFSILSLRYLVRFKGLQPKYIVLVFGAIAGIVIAYLAVPPVQLLLQGALFSKAGGYSALERIKTIVYAFSYFQEYPVLGVGWASVTSHDSIVKLLSNCGVVGLLAFICFVGSILLPLLRYIRSLDMLNRESAFGSPPLLMLIILLVTLAIAIVDGFPYVFGHFWIVLGLAMSAPAIGRQHIYLFAEDHRR